MPKGGPIRHDRHIRVPLKPACGQVGGWGLLKGAAQHRSFGDTGGHQENAARVENLTEAKADGLIWHLGRVAPKGRSIGVSGAGGEGDTTTDRLGTTGGFIETNMAIGSDAKDLEAQTSLARQQGGITQGLSRRIMAITARQQH